MKTKNIYFDSIWRAVSNGLNGCVSAETETLLLLKIEFRI